MATTMDHFVLLIRNPYRDEIEAVLGPYLSQAAAHRDLDWLLQQGMNEDMQAGDENVGAFRLLTKEEFRKQFASYFVDPNDPDA